MPIITYDSLKQQADQTDSLQLSNSDGLIASGSVANPPTANIPTQNVDLPVDDFNSESGLSGKSSDLNKLLSFKDGDNIKKNNYAGSQVLINSDRIIVNSRLDYLSLIHI